MDFQSQVIESIQEGVRTGGLAPVAASRPPETGTDDEMDYRRVDPDMGKLRSCGAGGAA